MKLPSFFLKVLAPHLKDQTFIKLKPMAMTMPENVDIRYYSELKLLIIDLNDSHIFIEQFPKNSSDDINIKQLGLEPHV